MIDALQNTATGLLQSGGIWLIPALLSTLIAMQGLKAVVKVLCGSWNRTYRQWLLFVLAFTAGYVIGLFFLTGPDAHKWAVMVGLVNPILYFGLVQYAVAKNRMVLLSILKMRPLKDTGTKLTLDDTQVFFVKQKHEDSTHD